MLSYKGYTGHVELDHESRIFHGEVLDLRDVITFQGTSVEELEHAFRESVDDYLEFCEARHEEPDKPFSGRLMVRLAPQLHRRIYLSAKREGKSLNQWISEKLERMRGPFASPMMPTACLFNAAGEYPTIWDADRLPLLAPRRWFRKARHCGLYRDILEGWTGGYGWT